MTGGKRKIRFESYLEVVSGLMQILEDEKQNSALQEAIYKRIRGTYINIFKDYLKVPESERDELFGEKNNTLGFKADSVATITDSSVEIDDARVQKFSHGVVATGTKELKLNTEFSKIAIAFDSPILIPTTVVNVNNAFITLVSGTILLTKYCKIRTSKRKS
jgi:hypothetical protein